MRAPAGSRFRRRRTVRAGGLGAGWAARAVRRVWENALFPPPGVCLSVSARPNCLDPHPPCRRRPAAAWALAVLAGAALSGGVMAAVVRTPNVEAELVAERTALTPGRPLTVALRLKMREGWHTYWLNPGDSGLPTTLEWTLPAGLTAGPIVWPSPHALPAGPLVNYGYEGEVFHLVELAPAASLAAGAPVTVSARADWLVCKETCIPEGADLSLTLPVASTSDVDPTWGPRIAATRAALPQPLAAWQASARGDGATIALKLVPPPGAKDPGALFFFPFAEARIEPSAPQKLARDGDAFVLTLPVASTLAGDFGRVAGVVTASNGFGGADASAAPRAATIDLALAGAVTAGPKPALAAAPSLNVRPVAPPGGDIGLLTAVAFALVGGLILNLMPCVFPVLSLKVLGFATHHDSKATLHREAVAFAVGVIGTFVVLGLLLAALRAAGEQLGWGFQLQSPAVVTGLALLFFALALNLSGVFEFGMLAPQGVAGWSSKNRTVDAFGSGVLAVVVASPCTAPFMGAAMGYALTGSTATTLAVFVALGAGMALPYMLLAWFPGWRRRLPKPGPWLERFKQLLAFPLYATVVWLAWVLGTQRDIDAVLRLMVALLALGFALWAWRIVRVGGGRGWAIAGLAALVGGVAVAWPLVTADADALPAAERGARAGAGDWIPYTPAKLAEITAGGRPVFVDFTAAWCVTCQVNKKLVLTDPQVLAALDGRNVARVRADWTRRDPEITRALAALGRNGVPVYVLYRPGKEPLLLPEVLQRQTLIDALATM
jgi:thiol:disulfide interchange protein/DsbC/DsbD-like thiol-disulfide interchange protein